MFQQPVCKGCGQPIWGSYLNALGATWHPEHFVCAGCGRPINGTRFNEHQGKPYHAECFSNLVAPRCAYCGKPLTGEYLVDHWGTHFCVEHQSQYLTCSFCARLVPPEDKEARGEHIRCAVCRASAIETEAQARPIFRQLIQWVGSQGLRYNNLRLSLEICSRASLARHLQGQGSIHSFGATTGTTHMLDGQVVQTEVTGVAVLLGLPSTLFQGVVIHELGHVWMIANGVQNLPSWAEEGFCELLSHRYYTELNTPESRYYADCIERNPNLTYSNGYRQIRSLVDRTGFQRFIEILRTTKRLPSQ